VRFLPKKAGSHPHSFPDALISFWTTDCKWHDVIVEWDTYIWTKLQSMSKQVFSFFMTNGFSYGSLKDAFRHNQCLQWLKAFKFELFFTCPTQAAVYDGSKACAFLNASLAGYKEIRIGKSWMDGHTDAGRNEPTNRNQPTIHQLQPTNHQPQSTNQPTNQP